MPAPSPMVWNVHAHAPGGRTPMPAPSPMIWGVHAHAPGGERTPLPGWRAGP